MKTLIAVLVAASFLGTMGVAQAGVHPMPLPAASPSNKAVTTLPTTALATAQNAADQSKPAQDKKKKKKGAVVPKVAGTNTARHHSMSNGEQLGIVIGAVAGVALILSASGGGGGSHAPSGSTGTTGTN